MSATKQVSFLPDDFLDKKQRHRTNLLYASLFLIATVSVVTALWLNRRTLVDLEHRFVQVDQEYRDGAKRIEQVKQMQEKQRVMDSQTELSASLLERVPRSRLLAEITNSRPEGVSLLELDMISTQRAAPSPPSGSAFDAAKAATDTARRLPAPKQYDVMVKLQGVASSDVQVASFISKLSGSPLLSDVNLQVSEEFMLNSAKLRKFQIDMKVNPAAKVTVDGSVATTDGGQ